MQFFLSSRDESYEIARQNLIKVKWKIYLILNHDFLLGPPPASETKTAPPMPDGEVKVEKKIFVFKKI